MHNLSTNSTQTKRFHLHLVSDSTGETVGSVARAAMAQFDHVMPDEHVWPLIRSKTQLEKMIASLDRYPGVVMSTLVDVDMLNMLRNACAKRGLPCIAVLGPVTRELSNYLDVEAIGAPGSQHELGEQYFSRIDAINFALEHDDGQAGWNLEQADIVLVGVSRTSKSPTCVYLAHRGFKAANVPYVPGCPLPDTLLSIKHPLVVGLTISGERLIDIRTSRLQSLKQSLDSDYVGVVQVKAEIEEAKRLFRNQGWPVIDVTRRSVEETAAHIITYRQRQIEKNKQAEKDVPNEPAE
jgi:regulator of PEP synthase PpsR (kinase-PPPase family)